MADLERARDDLGLFAALAGVPLEPWQAEAASVHAREARETAVVGPRRSGKSRAAAVKALHHCYRAPDSHALVIASSEEGARRLVAECRSIATRSPLLAPSVRDEQSQLLTFSNASTLRCVAATDAAVRGWRASLVVADEAALIPDSVLVGAARPIIASEPDGRFLMISSAVRAGGAFFDAIRRGEAGARHTAAFRWSLADCGWISPTEIEAARESMTPIRFAAEYLGQFASGEDSLFSRQALERVTVDFLAERLDMLRGPAKVTAGVDWGFTTDKTAIACIGRLAIAAEQPVFGVRCAHAWPSGYSVPAAIDEIVSSPALFDVIASETVGLGGPLTQMLFARLRERAAELGGGIPPSKAIVVDAANLDDFLTGKRHWIHPSQARSARAFVTTKVAVHTSAPIKSVLFSTLRLLVEREQLLIPADAHELRRQLALLRVDLSATGLERVEASTGHDDLADALAFALIPLRRRNGEWKTFIGDLAEQPLPAPAIDLRDLDLPTVTTGGGLALPRRPLWQSPRGTAVTVPEGVDPRPRERIDPRLQDLRDSLAAALNTITNQKEDSHAR